MANPSYVTAADVYFNDQPVNTAMIYHDTVNQKFYHVMWDQMAEQQQQAFVAAVNAVGGTVPLSSPISGYATLAFGDTPAASTSTVPPFVGPATAGHVTITAGSSVVPSTTIALPTGGNAAGNQRISFVGGTLSTTSTGFAPATSGYQTISFATQIVGTGATGLANDTTAYNTTVTINGTAYPITITGSSAQTYAALASAMTTAIGSAGTVAVSNGQLVITSASTGSTSTVLTTQGTLFTTTSMPGFVQINAAVPGTGSATTVTFSVSIDGGSPIAVSATEQSLQTYGDFVSAINTAIAPHGTAGFVGNDIVITSATTGSSSSVDITTFNLTALPGFAGVQQPVKGESKDYQYNATIVIDKNTYKTVSIMSSQITDFSDLVTLLGTTLVGAATVAMTGNVITITSATTGGSSSVRIYDSGLFGAIFAHTGQPATGVPFVSVAGTSAHTPSFTVIIDGISYNIVLNGSTIATYADVVTAINNVITTHGTAAMSGSAITITSATTGLTSTVKIIDNSVNSTYQRLGSSAKVTAQVGGATTMIDVLSNIPVGGGTLYDTLSVKIIGTKPPKPLTTIKNIREVYYNGTQWVYLFDDTPV